MFMIQQKKLATFTHLADGEFSCVMEYVREFLILLTGIRRSVTSKWDGHFLKSV
jgi:hypothetical protein